MSISGEVDLVLLRRGEVRRVRVVVVVVVAVVVVFVGFFFAGMVEREDEEFVDACDAFDGIGFNGGRAGAVRDDCVWGPVCGCGGDGARRGDDTVKSSVSISSCKGRSSGDAGIGVTWTVVVSRNFVGVADARQISSVVCLDMLGDEATDALRVALVTGAFLLTRIFAFSAGSCKGEGTTGVLTKSNVSMVSNDGGVFGRSKRACESAGSVHDRCIGARLLLLVTLGGNSTIGDSDFSRAGGATGFVL